MAMTSDHSWLTYRQANAIRRRLIRIGFLFVCLGLLLNGSLLLPIMGQDRHWNQPIQSQGDPVDQETQRHSELPTIQLRNVESVLLGIVRKSDAKMQTRNTGYINLQNSAAIEPGCHFQVPLSDTIADTIIEKLELVRQSKSDDHVRCMLTRFPYGWPPLNLDQCEWFGHRYNEEDTNYGNLKYMVIDRKSKRIFLTVASWNYTP